MIKGCPMPVLVLGTEEDWVVASFALPKRRFKSQGRPRPTSPPSPTTTSTPARLRSARQFQGMVCPAGGFGPSCDPCPAGSYCVDGVERLCSNGPDNAVYTAQGWATPSCPWKCGTPGTYVYLSACFPLPVGFYSPDGITKSPCVPTSAFFYSRFTTPGRTSSNSSCESVGVFRAEMGSPSAMSSVAAAGDFVVEVAARLDGPPPVGLGSELAGVPEAWSLFLMGRVDGCVIVGLNLVKDALPPATSGPLCFPTAGLLLTVRAAVVRADSTVVFQVKRGAQGAWEEVGTGFCDGSLMASTPGPVALGGPSGINFTIPLAAFEPATTVGLQGQVLAAKVTRGLREVISSSTFARLTPEAMARSETFEQAILTNTEPCLSGQYATANSSLCSACPLGMPLSDLPRRNESSCRCKQGYFLSLRGCEELGNGYPGPSLAPASGPVPAGTRVKILVPADLDKSACLEVTVWDLATTSGNFSRTRQCGINSINSTVSVPVSIGARLRIESLITSPGRRDSVPAVGTYTGLPVAATPKVSPRSLEDNQPSLLLLTSPEPVTIMFALNNQTARAFNASNPPIVTAGAVVKVWAASPNRYLPSDPITIRYGLNLTNKTNTTSTRQIGNSELGDQETKRSQASRESCSTTCIALSISAALLILLTTTVLAIILTRAIKKRTNNK